MKFSLVIPTFKRKNSLEKCLDSTLKQTYPKDMFEVVVIVDGKADDTKRILDFYIRRCPNIAYFNLARTQGPAAARNFGISRSRGEIIGFTDDDCILPEDWIEGMVKSHEQNTEAAVIGGLTQVKPDNPQAVISQKLSNISIKAKIKEEEKIIFFPTCNVSFKRWVFKHDKFDERFFLPGGEDLEFCFRLFKQGYKFIYRDNLKIFHNCHQTKIISYIKQAYNYGRGNYLVKYLHSEHPLLTDLRTGTLAFFASSLKNVLKIPHFSYCLRERFFKEDSFKNRKAVVYLYLALHKLAYITGSIVEFLKIKKSRINKKKKSYRIPELLILDITHACNLACRICDIWKTSPAEKDMDISYVKKMLYEAKKLGIKEISFSGGEPLLRKDIFEILNYARDLEIKNLGILTNGILIKEYIERLTPYLIDNTISPVISLDSLRPEIHNRVRSSSVAWPRTREGLEILSALKRKYANLNFNLITIVLNDNLEELLELAYFVRGLGANSFQFQALLPNNLKMAERKPAYFWVPDDRLDILDGMINKLIEFKKQNSDFVKNSAKNLSLLKKYYRKKISFTDVNCLSADKTILASNQGKCSTCFATYGDIKQQDLEEILKSKERLKAGRRVKKCAYPCLLPCFCDR